MLAIAGLVSYYTLQTGLPLPIVLATGLATGALIGLANGAVIAFLELPPIIVTLASLSIVRGFALILVGTDQHLHRRKRAGLYLHRLG